jgi:hypothetical protein
MLKKGLIAGLAIFVVGMALNFGLEMTIPAYAKEYQSSLFRPWQDPLMMAFLAYPFILGIVSAYLWSLVGKGFTGDWIRKAFNFAMLYFIVATIPGMYITLTTFNVSYLMVAVWTITGFVEVFIAGLVFAKLK